MFGGWSLLVFLATHFDVECGSYRGQDHYTCILDCRDDISSHLSRCHLTKEDIDTEYKLILYRSGFFDLSDEQLVHMKICPTHRYTVGKYWRPSRTCQYPGHTGRSSAVRGNHIISVLLAKDVQKLYGKMLPIGSRK